MSDLGSQIDMKMLDNIVETNDLLGRGSFGVVKLVFYRKMECAGKYFFSDTLNQERMLQECKRSYSIRHPNIVKTLGFCFSTVDPKSSIILVMEKMTYCLTKFVCEQERHLPEYLNRRILHDVSKGLAYLHSKDIIHRDLTANNVLLTDTLTAKISDFGQAKCIDPAKQANHTPHPGTMVYMPPEALIRENPNDPITYDLSLDIYSFGILMLIVYLHEPPQPQSKFMSMGELYRLRPPMEYLQDDIARALPPTHSLHKPLSMCLEKNPSQRPSAIELESVMDGLLKECSDSVFVKIMQNAVDYLELAETSKELRERNDLLSRELTLIGEDNIKLKNTYRTLVDMKNVYKQSARSRGQSLGADSPTNRTSSSSTVSRRTSNDLDRSTSSVDTRIVPIPAAMNQTSTNSNFSLTSNGHSTGSGDTNCTGNNRPSHEGDNESGARGFSSGYASMNLFANMDLSSMMSAQTQALYKEKDRLWEENKALRLENERLRNEVETLKANGGQAQPNWEDLLESIPNAVDRDQFASIRNYEEKPPPTVSYQDKDIRDFIDNKKKLKILCAAPLPFAFMHIEGAKAVCLNGEVYVGRSTTTILKYTRSSQEWSKLPPAPVKNYALTKFEGQLVLVGGIIEKEGSQGTVSSDVYFLDKDRDEWRHDTIPPLMTPRENAVAVDFVKFGSNKREFHYLIVLGGEKRGLFSNKILQTVEVYNGESRKWYGGAEIPRNGFNLQYVADSKFIYLLNPDGWTIRYCSLQRLVDSAIGNGSLKGVWQSISRQVPFRSCSLAIYDHSLLALAGTGSDGHVYTYYPKENRWKRVDCINSLPAVRNAYCLELSANELFMCGGDIDMINQTAQAGYILTIDDGTTESSDTASSEESPQLSHSHSHSYSASTRMQSSTAVD